MKYDPDTAKADHWHRTSKEDLERGYVPVKDEDKRLDGGKIPKQEPIGR